MASYLPGTTFRVYVNGVRELELSGRSGSITGSGFAKAIGNWWTDGAMSQWAGFMDELRFTIGSDRGYTGATIPVPPSAFLGG